MKLIDKTMLFVGYCTAFVLGFLVLLIVYDATVRYAFSGGSVALQELEWHLFDVVILFGIVYALRENAHVRVDIFYDKYSPKTKVLVNFLSTLFFILPFSFVIIYIGIDFVSMSFVQNEISSNPGGLEYRFLVKALLPLSFVFVSLQALREIHSNYLLWKSL